MFISIAILMSLTDGATMTQWTEHLLCRRTDSADALEPGHSCGATGLGAGDPARLRVFRTASHEISTGSHRSRAEDHPMRRQDSCVILESMDGYSARASRVRSTTSSRRVVIA